MIRVRANKYFILLLLLSLFYSFESFSHKRLLIVFHLRDNKSPNVSRALLSILADHNSAVVWMVLFPSSPGPLPIIGDSTDRTDYNWNQRHFHIA